MNSLSIEEQKAIKTIIAFLLIFIVKLALNSITAKYSKKFKYSTSRKVSIHKVVNFVLGLTIIVTISVIWDLTFKGLTLFFASFFTVAGIALFGNWSILSNITASLVLYFNYPFKIGDHIKILDGDNSISGEVMDINLFNIRLKTKEGHNAAYPNNLALQKGIIQLENSHAS